MMEASSWSAVLSTSNKCTCLSRRSGSDEYCWIHYDGVNKVLWGWECRINYLYDMAIKALIGKEDDDILRQDSWKR